LPIPKFNIQNQRSDSVRWFDGKLHSSPSPYFNVSSTNFINPYIIESHAVEEALNVEEVGGRRESQGPTLIIFIRCRTYGAHKKISP
jgi:hypothetical protein